MHLSIKPGLERAKISLVVTESPQLRIHPQQRGLQMPALILIALLLWPFNKGECVMLCPGETLGQRLGYKYSCQDAPVKEWGNAVKEGRKSIYSMLMNRLIWDALQLGPAGHCVERDSELSYPQSDEATIYMHQPPLSLAEDCSQGFRFHSLSAESFFIFRVISATWKYRACSRKWCTQRGYRKNTHFLAASSNPDRSGRPKLWWSHETKALEISLVSHIVLSVLQGPWPRNGLTVYFLKVTDGKGKARKSSVPWESGFRTGSLDWISESRKWTTSGSEIGTSSSRASPSSSCILFCPQYMCLNKVLAKLYKSKDFT